MCFDVKSSIFIINLLHHSKGVGLTYFQLGELEKKIEKKCPNIFVDISEDAINWALQAYPYLIVWRDDKICRAPDSNDYFTDSYIEAHFNSQMPSSLRKIFVKELASTA